MQVLETWKHRQSAEEKPEDGYDCPAGSGRPRLSRMCVENLALS